ncbi:MAG: glycosyltransferase [Pseudomonadota bacterium]|nr:glycosyltransferase [Pseudomonadota bacterium]
MAHFALITLPLFSHLRVFEAVAEELVSRGHRASFVLPEGAGRHLSKDLPEGVGLFEYGAEGPSAGLAERMVDAASRDGPLALFRTIAVGAEATGALSRCAPRLLDRLGCDAVIGDQTEPAAGLIAEALGLPLLSLAAALPMHRDESVPLPFLGWRYDPSDEGLGRNRGGELVARRLLKHQGRAIETACRELGLPIRSELADCLSTSAQVSQLVEAFDFPRGYSSIRHGVGPIRRRWRPAATAPAPIVLPEHSAGRPVVYVSLGTLQGHRHRLLKSIVAAARDLGAATIVAHCGRLTERQAASLEADHVADFVDQASALSLADVCVTHAGMNTVLDALRAGKPLLALPIAFDQPGIAARIVHHGVGLKLPRVLLSRRKLARALEALLCEDSYGKAAGRMAGPIRASGGAVMAADIAEAALSGSSRWQNKETSLQGLVA